MRAVAIEGIYSWIMAGAVTRLSIFELRSVRMNFGERGGDGWMLECMFEIRYVPQCEAVLEVRSGLGGSKLLEVRRVSGRRVGLEVE